MAQLREGSIIKKSTGDEIIATVNDIPEIPTSLPANGGNADTIGGFTVGADVPSNAKFTDTIVDISGKQDKLTAGDNITITNNTISATDTVYDDTSIQTELGKKADKTYVDSKVKTDVPSGAVFTDTVYSHPATHSADMITDGTTNKAYTSAEKTKLSGIDTNANNYSHPTTHSPSIIVQDTNNRFVTDAEKSTWNGKQNALGYTPLNSALKGAVSGIAELDANGRVPSSQLPSYVDDVLEYTSKSNFPVTGESGKIYISSDTNLTYRWSGTAYVEISASLALGETSSTAFFGDKGKVAYSHSQTTHAPSNATANDTDANLRNRSTHTGTQSADTITDGTNNKAFTVAEKTKLSGIDTNANNYSHPTGDGSKHVPANGTTNNGKVLKAGATAGTYIWSNDNDTITTINGKTGAIAKADIVALGIPAQDTVYTHPTTHSISEVSGLQTALDGKVDDSQVLTNVPLNAKFTDTVYTHPANHSPSIITQDANNRFVTDAEKSTWNSKAEGDHSHSGIYEPADATILKDADIGVTVQGYNANTVVDSSYVHTDNNYTTTEKNKLAGIAIGAEANVNADWNSSSGDSQILNKPTLSTVATSGSYTDLSNKPTIPDTSTLMPKSGGVLENYREKLVTLSGTSTSINLNNGNVFTHTLSGNTTYSISNAVNGQAHSFTLIITQTATVRTLTFPASVKWQGGEIPDMSNANKTYVLTFVTVNGGTTWLGMFGGEF